MKTWYYIVGGLVLLTISFVAIKKWVEAKVLTGYDIEKEAITGKPFGELWKMYRTLKSNSDQSKEE